MRRLALAALTGLGLAALLVTAVATLLAVAARFLDLTGLEWSYEVAGMAFVWTTFLGAALAEARRENAAFEALRAALPAPWQAALRRFGAVLLLGIGGALAASGLAALWRSGAVPTPLLRWPAGVQIAAAPVLGLCLCLIALPRVFGGGEASARGEAPIPGHALPDEGTGTPL